MAASAQEDVVLEEREEILAAVFEDAQQLEEELIADLSDHTESERLLLGELDDVIPEDPSKQEDVSTSQFGFKYMCIVLAVALRLLAYFYLKDLFESSPQLVTPWNSFKRFKEGVFLFESESVDDVYDGDMFHVMPMFIHVLRPTLDSMFWLRVEWAILDLFCAYLWKNLFASISEAWQHCICRISS
uniref:Uncharacterized protein n=1 Tax=Ditylenchus dipsaci TaxID=166011 RepID=A0A915E110_9BILA